ncbi:unannotated protein [freshwater metagenome]|uniref:Unannotated protein n=1 Tax=freshwater metagenome TaxID=449393 RepID=A0A6J6HLF8_9ZZZZ
MYQALIRRSLTIPLEPMRWLVVGCLGIALLGLVMPFPVFPPCPMLTVTGVPCPMCGMTRSVRSFSVGDIDASIRYQPFGIIAAIVGIGVLALWATPTTRRIVSVRIPVVIAVSCVAGSWIWNIGFNPTF